MSRLGLFTLALLTIVAIGTQTKSNGNLAKSVCVCMPARAQAFFKSAIVKTQTQVAELTVKQ